jgi:hypothetical protein
MGRKIKQEVGIAAAGVILAGLLAAHLFPPIVPRAARMPSGVTVAVCRTAPAAAWVQLPTAIERMGKLGSEIGILQRVDCAPVAACGGLACVSGVVTVDLAGADVYLGDEVGRCTVGPGLHPTWAVIEVSSTTLSADFPLILAHELGHCALGYQHAQGRFGLSAPIGHLMNPRFDRMGWTTAGM